MGEDGKERRDMRERERVKIGKWGDRVVDSGS